MDTSDDFLTGGGSTPLPTSTAQNVTKTAAKADTGSDAARKNRLRRRAAAGKDLGPLKLGTPGLLGFGEQQQV